MMVLSNRKYALEEYFEIERRSEEKFKYYDGRVQSVSGASSEHERIVVNIAAELRSKLRGEKYTVFGFKPPINLLQHQYSER